MITFTLVIVCENDAFCDEEGKPDADRRAQEIARIMREHVAGRLVADPPMPGDTMHRLLDANGSSVGGWTLKEE